MLFYVGPSLLFKPDCNLKTCQAWTSFQIQPLFVASNPYFSILLSDWYYVSYPGGVMNRVDDSHFQHLIYLLKNDIYNFRIIISFFFRKGIASGLSVIRCFSSPPR